MILQVGEKGIVLNNHGHLANVDDWDQAVATALAKTEDIELTEAHWQIIHLIRDFYQRFEHIPPLRIFVKTVAKELDPEKGRSIYLYKLFPDGPLRQACKIAGLPKPKHCL